jgi:hypothetical protein
MQTPRLLLLQLLLAASVPAVAVPTDITVRVLAKDGKFIGSSFGGVRVTIADADTGEVLAQGVTQGGEGDSARILEQPRKRGTALATADAASFHASIDIDRPRRVEVSAFGPLVYPQAANGVSSTQWVVPGRHISAGDAWLLEMPGLFVQIVPADAPVALAGGSAKVRVAAKVVMMCGCPLSPGGLWDSNRYEVAGSLLEAGKPVGETKLAYTGNASEFAGEIEVREPGAYEAMVYAYDPATGNTGVARASVLVTE